MQFRVQDLGFRGPEFRVEDLGFRGPGFRVEDLGFKVKQKSLASKKL